MSNAEDKRSPYSHEDEEHQEHQDYNEVDPESLVQAEEIQIGEIGID